MGKIRNLIDKYPLTTGAPLIFLCVLFLPLTILFLFLYFIYYCIRDLEEMWETLFVAVWSAISFGVFLYGFTDEGRAICVLVALPVFLTGGLLLGIINEIIDANKKSIPLSAKIEDTLKLDELKYYSASKNKVLKSLYALEKKFGA